MSPPYAALLRYEALTEEEVESVFDGEGIAAFIDRTIQWAEAILAEEV